ncbi:MAG: radical SAM protein [bacterium]
MPQEINEIYKSCNLCPRECKIDRTNFSSGTCGLYSKLKIASFGPHYGEEPEIVGRTASGTIFLSGCNLHCCFCQNFDISHQNNGIDYSIDELTDILLYLENLGCDNINLVTPTHFTPSLINSILKAKSYGLSIPIIYNTSGFEKVEILKMWEGIIDIYMPDLKFVDSEKSKLYCNCPEYFEFAAQAVKEMHRQKGDLIIKNGIAKRGLLIRHLILPNNQSDTKDIIDFVAEELGLNTYLNLMDQYRPMYNAYQNQKLIARIDKDELLRYVDYAKSMGFTRPDWLYSDR